MPLTKQFNQLDPINNGTVAANNFKLSDSIPAQHSDVTGGVNKLVKRTFAQMLCEPVAVSNSNNPNNGAYTATCQNYPDFAVNYQDEQMSTHYYVGLKIRVIFNYGITYGSVSGGTYPTLNINSSGALPLLAQGKTMAAGAASNGQSLELTLIPYGNGYAWDADSNVRESTSDYTIYTDGSTKYTGKHVDAGFAKMQSFNRNLAYVNSSSRKYLKISTGIYPPSFPYFGNETLLLVDNNGSQVSVLNIIKNDNGIAAELTSLFGTNYLRINSIAAVSDVVVYLETIANWSKAYTVYSLSGSKPVISAENSI